jgi:hypothetical protein
VWRSHPLSVVGFSEFSHSLCHGCIPGVFETVSKTTELSQEVSSATRTRIVAAGRLTLKLGQKQLRLSNPVACASSLLGYKLISVEGSGLQVALNRSPHLKQ